VNTTHAIPEGYAQVVEQIISAISVGQIAIASTLHSQGVIDKRHFVYAFARAIDALAQNPDNRLLVSILQVTKDALLQSGEGDHAGVNKWVGKVLAPDPVGGTGDPS